MKFYNFHHTNIRHKCQLCDATFIQRFSLKTHIDSVHKGIKVTCTVCDKSFSKKSTLTKHILQVHEKNEKNNDTKET